MAHLISMNSKKCGCIDSINKSTNMNLLSPGTGKLRTGEIFPSGNHLIQVYGDEIIRSYAIQSTIYTEAFHGDVTELNVSEDCWIFVEVHCFTFQVC